MKNIADNHMVYAIGLMSGTSLDGVDAAIIRTDGNQVEDTGYWYSHVFSEELRGALRAVMAGDISAIGYAEREITIEHAKVVQAVLEKSGIAKQNIKVLGFHGQTILHKPEEGFTCQLGNPSLLAEETGIDVVADFRRRDMAAGGQGAPLVPLYHAAIFKDVKKPVAILNLGGVGNVTYLGEKKESSTLHEDIMAFDTGPGNALVDDWIKKCSGNNFDTDGRHAAKGKVNRVLLDVFLADPFFAKNPPKSLDRNHFHYMFENEKLKNLSMEDGAATLSAFTIHAVVKASAFFPSRPVIWYVTGGGRLNKYMTQHLRTEMNADVVMIEEAGFNGDMLEAQAFGYLAVRSLKGLPLTLPTTTGVRSSVTGGAFYRA